MRVKIHLIFHNYFSLGKCQVRISKIKYADRLMMKKRKVMKMKLHDFKAEVNVNSGYHEAFDSHAVKFQQWL